MSDGQRHLLVEPLFDLTMEVGQRVDIGLLPSGTRRYIAHISGGSFSGARLRGRVMSGGADWLAIRDDGHAQLDIRMVLQTDDGVPIYVSSGGLLSPARQSHGDDESAPLTMRIFMTFETSDADYIWLNDVVAFARGEAGPDGIIYRVFEMV